MYRFDCRVTLDPAESLDEADSTISELVKTLHLTICKINRLQKVTRDGLERMGDARQATIAEFGQERALSAAVKQELMTATTKAKERTEDEVASVRSALDLIQNIRALREERRVKAHEARSTRRGVLMAQLQVTHPK